MQSNNAIETHQLRKEFGPKVAVRGLDLEVHRGEVFGFLGPNGAGKSTSIKMFLDLVHPSSGSVLILDRPITDPRVRSQIGFLPEHFRFHDWLTADEFLRLHGDLYNFDSKQLKSRVDELLNMVGLAPFRNNQLRTYSKGMLQRIGLAQALLNRPALVFLDEPTSGLDPVGRRLVRDIIRGLRSEGATVFLNSHLLSEVEITCDRVAFIKHGEVLQINELSSLNNAYTHLTIYAKGFTASILADLSRWGKDIQLEGDNISLFVEQESDLPLINRFLVNQGVEIFAFTPQRTSLEDLFIQIVGTDGGL